MGRLEGKVALVTGGASGIGAETSRVFAREGAKVAVTDVNDNGGNVVATEIGDAAFYAHLDTRSEAEWLAVVKQAVDTYSRLDILVNAAGVPGGSRSDGTGSPKIDEQDLEDWNRVMDVNSTGIFLGMKSVVPEMRKAGGGSIINISSIYGLVGSVTSAAYHAVQGEGTVAMMHKSFGGKAKQPFRGSYRGANTLAISSLAAATSTIPTIPTSMSARRHCTLG